MSIQNDNPSYQKVLSSIDHSLNNSFSIKNTHQINKILGSVSKSQNHKAKKIKSHDTINSQSRIRSYPSKTRLKNGQFIENPLEQLNNFYKKKTTIYRTRYEDEDKNTEENDDILKHDYTFEHNSKKDNINLFTKSFNCTKNSKDPTENVFYLTQDKIRKRPQNENKTKPNLNLTVGIFSAHRYDNECFKFNEPHSRKKSIEAYNFFKQKG